MAASFYLSSWADQNPDNSGGVERFSPGFSVRDVALGVKRLEAGCGENRMALPPESQGPWQIKTAAAIAISGPPLDAKLKLVLAVLNRVRLWAGRDERRRGSHWKRRTHQCAQRRAAEGVGGNIV